MRGHITKIAMSKYHIIIIIVGVVVLEMHLIPPKLFSLLYFHDFFCFQVCYATFCGQIPTKMSKVGAKMIEAFPSPLELMWSPNF